MIIHNFVQFSDFFVHGKNIAIATFLHRMDQGRLQKWTNYSILPMSLWRNEETSYQPKFLANFRDYIFLKMSKFSSKYCSQVSISEVYLIRPKSFWQLKIKLNKIFDPEVDIMFTPFTPKQGYISPNMDNRSSVPSIS